MRTSNCCAAIARVKSRWLDNLLERHCGQVEIKEQGGNVGQRERDWARGDFGIQLQPVEQRGHRETEKTRRAKRQKNSATDHRRRCRNSAPEPNNKPDENAASRAKQHGGPC